MPLLDPCRCGSQRVMFHQSAKGSYWCWCVKCGARSDVSDSAQGAMERWNRMPKPAERLEKALDELTDQMGLPL